MVQQALANAQPPERKQTERERPVLGRLVPFNRSPVDEVVAARDTSQRAHARCYRDLIRTDGNELEPIVRFGLWLGLSLWNARILYTMPSPDLGLIFSR